MGLELGLELGAGRIPVREWLGCGVRMGCRI